MNTDYYQSYDTWKADPEAFWSNASDEIDWVTPATKIFDPGAGEYGRWFAGAECNTCFNCVDRHVENGRANVNGIEYDLSSPESPRVSELLNRFYKDVQVEYEIIIERWSRCVRKQKDSTS